MESVTELLVAYRGGDRAALDRLVPLVYAELRRIAARYIGRERAGHTLQPTALVNEAYIRMVQGDDVAYQNRSHFVGIAARLMRQILVDHARTRDARKRGGELARVTLDEGVARQEAPSVDLILLDDAIRRLEEKDPGLCRLVELRYFGGLSIEETAEALGTSPATVKRDWAAARVWLRRLIEHGAHGTGSGSDRVDAKR
jgi:RNA polymerase sigma-70 factor (ECF subfamily)